MNIAGIEVDTTLGTTPKAQELIRLVCHNRRLYVAEAQIHDPVLKKFLSPGDSIIVLVYDEGDADTIEWPNPNRGKLARALYDARETGLIPDVRLVLLPDDSPFEIEQELLLTAKARVDLSEA